MNDIKNRMKAEYLFGELCDCLEDRLIVYESDADALSVSFTAIGADFPMRFDMLIDPDNMLINVYSPMPLRVLSDKAAVVALAVLWANRTLPEGCFVYSAKNDIVYYRTVACYADSKIGSGLFDHLIETTCKYVDLFNDRFFDLNCGRIDIAQFIAFSRSVA